MQMYFPLEARITPLTTLRRERLLPVRGEVLARPGEWVGADDVIAHCQLPGRLRVLDLGQALGVRRERATRYLLRNVGETIRLNELLAERSGPLGWRYRTCHAPADGRIVAIRSGQIVIQEAGTPFELHAQVDGQVTSVIPEQGAVISMVGALIEGSWGNGGGAWGLLRIVVDDPQEPLPAQLLAGDCRGALVVAGWIPDQSALEGALEAKVQGIIAGSVNAELCPLLQSLPYCVLITEGFGTLPMSRRRFSLLAAFAGHKASVRADLQAGWRTDRPEVVIPLEVEEPPPPEEPRPSPLHVGARVRGLRAPYLGLVGSVTDLPRLPQLVESGARLPVARVMMESGESVSIPQVNLQLIH
jgi:hypothetical protein